MSSTNIDRNNRIWTTINGYLEELKCNWLLVFRTLVELRKEKIDISLVKSEDGLPILHSMVKLKRVNYIRFVADAGLWNVFYPLIVTDQNSDCVGQTAKQLAETSKSNDVIEKLQALEEIEQELKPLLKCARIGNVEEFLRLNSKDSQALYEETKDGSCVLDFAVISGSPGMVRAVLDTDYSRKIDKARSAHALAAAVLHGHHHLLKMLYDLCQLRIDDVVEEELKLCEIAVKNGDWVTYEALLQLGATPTERILLIAAVNDRRDFLEKIDEDTIRLGLSYKEKGDQTGLMLAAGRGHTFVVNILLQKGAILTETDTHKLNVMHYASDSGNVDTVNVIIRAAERQRCLHRLLYSKSRQHKGSSCFLVRGADRGKHAWHYVHVDRGRLNKFKENSKAGTLDVAKYGYIVKSGWGRSPGKEDAKSVEEKYVVGVSEDSLDDLQPLHTAILAGHEKVTLRLVDVMDDVSHPDHAGHTPLHLAAMMGNCQMIRALLRKRAEVNTKDSEGRTAKDIAEINEHCEATELLSAVRTATVWEVTPINTDHSLEVSDRFAASGGIDSENRGLDVSEPPRAGPGVDNPTLFLLAHKEELRRCVTGLLDQIADEKLEEYRRNGGNVQDKMSVVLREIQTNIGDFLCDRM